MMIMRILYIARCRRYQLD